MKQYRTRASRKRQKLLQRIVVGIIAGAFLVTLVGSVFIHS